MASSYVAPRSPHLVPFNGRFKLRSAATGAPADAPPKLQRQDYLKKRVGQLDELQRRLYASNHHSVLLIFQAMDAAGKDSTIRAVLTGVDPAGCQVHAFKRPSEHELDHDFLWRHLCALPERGRIGVFNRSWYEEVLAVRVHPEYLKFQRLPHQPKTLAALWRERYESINAIEKHLARNGTLVLKFWLNVSHEEQRKRLLERLADPSKNWKFESGDLGERARWNHYMEAYEDMLRATSRPWAPWYAIPADSKSYMRMAVADIIVRALARLKLRYPPPRPELSQDIAGHRKALGDKAAPKVRRKQRAQSAKGR